MYSVFLVDDEIVVREGIRNSACWEGSGYTLVGEAPDGEMALSIMKDVKPDILITDIKMPFMDGLALARIIRKTQPWVKIIILSGHDEFQYAREAISIGVEEYLLKPFSSVELSEVLARIGKRITDEKEKLSRLENLMEQVNSTADIRRDRWLSNLVAGLIPPSEAIEQAREFAIDLIAHGYLVVVIEIYAGTEYSRELLKARVMIQAQLCERGDVILFSQGAERQILIVNSREPDSLEETAYTIAEGLRFEVEKDTHCKLSAGIGQPVERIRELVNSYNSADSVLSYMAKDEQKWILGINDIGSDRQIASLISLEVESLADSLKYAGMKDVENIVGRYSEVLAENDGHSAFICYYLLGDLIIASSRIIEDLGGAVEEVIPEFLHQEKISNAVESDECFCRQVRSLIVKVIQFRETRLCGKYSSMIRRAQEYIQAHFSDPNISLHTVAEYVSLSPNHFSTVYSQETSKTFIEYLTEVRLDRAQTLLLTTDKRNSEIGYECGFNDPHYFSFLFKKNLGISPREFRSRKNPSFS